MSGVKSNVDVELEPRGEPMKHLSRDRHIYVLDPAGAPAITIVSGEELMVETWDAFEGVRDPAVLEARSLKGPATGPIYVDGAEPGDALRVDFMNITAKDGAAHMVMPDRGFLEAEFPEGYPTVMTFEDGQVMMPSGVRLPLVPSMGFVATTPTYRQQTASDSGLLDSMWTHSVSATLRAGVS